MSSPYQPVAAALPALPWSMAILSQRDLSLRIPINYVTYPGVIITKACFGHNVFHDEAAALCFSNLLAAGFRRLILDLYWDDRARVWSFCPVMLPRQTSGNSVTSMQTSFTTSLVTISNVEITPRSIVTSSSGRTKDVTNDMASMLELHQRQTNPPTSISFPPHSASVQSSGVNTARTTAYPQPTSNAVPVNGGTLVQAGPYFCSPSIDLAVFTEVLARYLQSSSNTLQASINYLTMNLHVAAPYSKPFSPAQYLNTSAVPNLGELISAILKTNLSSYLYTPTLLKDERANLNSSWYAVSAESQPLGVYLNTTLNSKGELTTHDGWPTESFLEFRQAANSYRLMVAFGAIDSELRLYNTSGDDAIIFPRGTFHFDGAFNNFTANTLDSPCHFNGADPTFLGGNNSWAVSANLQLPSDAQAYVGNNTLASVSNLTTCGISPVLNETLLNVTADVNIAPYQHFVYSSIWQWSAGEPRNATTKDDAGIHIRCAAFEASSNGRWRNADCTEHRYAACRTGQEPYGWRISSSKATYHLSDETCPSGSSFAVPRTALENRHLLDAVMQHSKDPVIWVNFNSLDVSGCWVTGVTSTCPYRLSPDSARRTVLVPVVAGVIVFVVTALTLFIKCAANRQKSRRRRRRRRSHDGWDEGWEYEGVPS